MGVCAAASKLVSQLISSVVLYSMPPRKHLNYTLDWKVNLAENLVAIGPYGGLVGKVSTLTQTQLTKR